MIMYYLLHNYIYQKQRVIILIKILNNMYLCRHKINVDENILNKYLCIYQGFYMNIKKNFGINSLRVGIVIVNN